MVKQGNTIIIITVEELEQDREATVMKTLQKAKDLLLNEKPARNTLTIEGVMKLFKKERSTIQAYRRRKTNPLPMVGTPPIIEEDVAWEWYVKFSGEYQVK